MKLNFYKNWNNKLGCDYFPSIRLAKEKYKIGEIYEVWLSNKFLGKCELISKKHMYFNEMTEEMALIDSGMKKNELATYLTGLYGNLSTKKLLFMVFKYTNKNNSVKKQTKIEF